MYVIVKGKATVDPGGREHTLKQGEFFGEMALVAARKRIATVRSSEPVTALRVGAYVFQSFLMQHPAVAVGMLKATIERLREVEERIDAWIGTGETSVRGSALWAGEGLHPCHKCRDLGSDRASGP